MEGNRLPIEYLRIRSSKRAGCVLRHYGFYLSRVTQDTRVQGRAIPFEKHPPGTQIFSQWTIPSKFNKIIIHVFLPSEKYHISILEFFARDRHKSQCSANEYSTIPTFRWKSEQDRSMHWNGPWCLYRVIYIRRTPTVHSTFPDKIRSLG